jgi:hypothetical protein
VQALHASLGEDKIYMIEHENIGHDGRAEAVDETTFVAQQFGVTQLSSLVKPPNP